MDDILGDGPPIEGLRRMLRGVQEPSSYLTLVGLVLEAVDEGSCAVAFDPGPEHLNLVGLVHGGVAAGMMDTALGAAAISVCHAGERAVTLDLNLTYHRPLVPGAGRVHATATVIKRGRRIIACEGRIHDAAGKLAVTGTGTFVVVDAEA